MDETFYSENRSLVNKSNYNGSMFGNNETNYRDLKRQSNYQKLAEQLPGINLPQYFTKSNALSKADSVYSSNNVPVIKNYKTTKIRPMSMKQPRRLRQKIDDKYAKNNADLPMNNDMIMPTVWNSKNPQSFVQIPFKNSGIGGMDNSFTSLVKSPENMTNLPEERNESLR